MNSLRAGEYRKNLSGNLSYKSYKPAKLPIEIEIDEELQNLIKKAYIKLEEINNLGNNIILESQIIKKEVFFSTKIESKKLDEDIFDKYEVESIKYGLQRLKSFPLSNRLIKEIQQILLNNKKYSGEFRRSQNWVGEAFSTINTAIYIPPAIDDMIECMNNLEIYINNEEINQDNIIKLAFFHYQLDAINPFLEGNSKLVRMLSTLFLIDKNIINNFYLSLSYYIEREITQYYGRMRSIRETGDFEQFIKFFIRIIINSAEDTLNTVKNINKIRLDNLEKINGEDNLLRVYRRFEKELVLKSSESEEIKKLISLKIVTKINENLFCLEKYMDELKIWL